MSDFSIIILVACCLKSRKDRQAELGDVLESCRWSYRSGKGGKPCSRKQKQLQGRREDLRAKKVKGQNN